MSKRKFQFTEGMRVRMVGGIPLPDKNGEWIATKQLAGGQLEFVRMEVYEALQTYNQELEAAKQAYLDKITAIRKKFDARVDELNAEDKV